VGLPLLHEAGGGRGKQRRAQGARYIGPPPHETGSEAFATAQKWLNHYLCESDANYLRKQLELVQSAADFSPQEFSIPLLLPALVAMDLPRQGYHMPLPFFIIQGEEAHITPTELAAEYFRRIRAPLKRMVLLKRAGHLAYATNRKEFLDAHVKHVRPTAAEPAGL